MTSLRIADARMTQYFVAVPGTSARTSFLVRDEQIAGKSDVDVQALLTQRRDEAIAEWRRTEPLMRRS